MGVECQTIKIKKVPYSESDPIFSLWSLSYSAVLYNTYTTVSSYSAIWNSGGNTSSLSSLTANWQNTFNYFSVQSSNNINVYNTVNTNSANWNYQGTDLKSLTSNWQNTFNYFSVQSSNNINVYNTVFSNSADWNYQGTDLKSLTSNWQNTFVNFNTQSANNINVYNTVFSNSADWNQKTSLFTEFSSITNVNSAKAVFSLIVSSISANIDVSINPKGTGGFSLQTPDGTVTGGNKRGDYAVDLQRIRSVSPIRVASGTYSLIVNGNNNTSNNTYASVLNGFNNSSSNIYTSIINGSSNNATNSYASIINGSSNNATNSYASIINGMFNISNGVYSVILNGLSNNVEGSYASIINGISNINTGNHSIILGGYNNNCSSSLNVILNSNYAVANRYGQISKANTFYSNAGDAQKTEFLLYGKSTDSIITELTLDNSTEKLTINNNSVNLCTIQILGVDEDANISQFFRKLTIKNQSNIYTLSHIESIGTDLDYAGNCEISVDDVKGIVLSCGSLPDSNTVWLASVIAVELDIPQPYTNVSILSINNGISNTTTNIDELFS